jgi:hypothetical protein
MYKYTKIVNNNVKGLVIIMKKWAIVTLVIAIFLLSIISGFIVKSYINFSNKKEESNQAVLADKEDEVVNTSSADETVSPNAKIIMTETFERCGHTVTVKEDVPREIVNLTKDKVYMYYKDWNVDEFNKNEIKISRKNKGICNEHYIIGESNGFISISTKNDIGEYIFKGLTDISVQYLPEKDLESLEKGIEIIGKENLNKYLEDFE